MAGHFDAPPRIEGDSEQNNSTAGETWRQAKQRLASHLLLQDHFFFFFICTFQFVNLIWLILFCRKDSRYFSRHLTAQTLEFATWDCICKSYTDAPLGYKFCFEGQLVSGDFSTHGIALLILFRQIIR